MCELCLFEIVALPPLQALHLIPARSRVLSFYCMFLLRPEFFRCSALRSAPPNLFRLSFSHPNQHQQPTPATHPDPTSHDSRPLLYFRAGHLETWSSTV
ncbi:unnamed protein product [Chondrus crispus]|uniref:Uncharacterized protein n=1 Tax=Chondrus crispus TaxID=2769 RepID=R7Q8S7_CHOCR|nr:unnamed protein product [Chondrus crispus]CDF33796.1 unnamed protein product [Chondrus crispus]|eukprot:XP_005713615.1 unnamed protein product [Chondrus crispus]